MHLLVDDLIPYIDANFRTLADQPHRAMAGLSMGAMQTHQITMAHLETFSHIGLFSGGSIALGDIGDLETFKKSNKLVFVSYGGHELGDGGPRRKARSSSCSLRHTTFDRGDPGSRIHKTKTLCAGHNNTSRN